MSVWGALFVAYLVIGLLIAEAATVGSKIRRQKITFWEYIIAAVLWPVVIGVWIWRNRK